VAAPQYVPSTIAEQPRRGLDLPPAGRWVSDRPGDLGSSPPVGDQLGRPGPDQGYALRLARHFADKLVVAPPERSEDAVAGCVAVAMARSSLFGRAPIVHDLDIAFRIWGFLGDAPDELVQFRQPLFEAVDHRYSAQRTIVDQVPETTLRLSHGQVASRFPADWRALLGLS
jgi:hypothetical protein